MAFVGWDPRMMQETMRQGYMDRQEIMRQQRANDAQDLHNRIIAQEASKNGLFDNDPAMQKALGISRVPFVDPRDLGYSSASSYGADQPVVNKDGSLGQSTAQTDYPVAPITISHGPMASGYLNAEPESSRPTQYANGAEAAQAAMDAHNATSAPSQTYTPPGYVAPQASSQGPASGGVAPAAGGKSYTRQTLEKLNELFPGQVDLESGTMNASLQAMIEKNQAQQAQLQSLLLMNQLKGNVTLTTEQMKAALAKQLADANNQTKASVGAGHDRARVTAAELAASRARAAATKGSISGGKDVIADNLWKSADDNVKGIQKNPGGALLGQETINAYKADQAYIEGEVAAGRKVNPGSLPSRRGSGMASPPAGSPAPPGKTVSKATYFKNTDTTHIIYSDGSTADVKGRPSGSP